MDIILVDPETFARMQQSDQSPVVYECKLQDPCGIFLEGTHTGISAHLRRHGISTRPDDNNAISCPWGSCSKIIKKGNLTRHILTHLGVKARCSMCGLVKCRRDVIRAHITSSERCNLAFSDVVHGPEGRVLIGTVSTATGQV